MIVVELAKRLNRGERMMTPGLNTNWLNSCTNSKLIENKPG